MKEQNTKLHTRQGTKVEDKEPIPYQWRIIGFQYSHC